MVTDERDGTHLGLSQTTFLDPIGEMVSQVPTGTPGMATIEFRLPTQSITNDA